MGVDARNAWVENPPYMPALLELIIFTN